MAREFRMSSSFGALVGAQFLGAFNDNLFKQLLLFLAALTLFPGEDKQGVAFAVFAAPFILFGGWAGDLSERYSKRTLIVGMKLAEIAVMVAGTLALASGRWGLMLVVLFLMGTQSAFFGPSKYGVIPEIVGSPHLLQANGVISMTTFLAILLGQALAGPLLDGLGQQLWITGAICAGVAVMGTWVASRMEPLEPRNPHLIVRRNPFGSIWGTICELRRQPGLMSVVATYSIFWFNGGLLQQAITGLGGPGYLNVGLGEARLLSLLLVVLAVSIIIGSVAVPRVARRIRPARLVMMGASGMALCQLGLCLIGPVFNRHNGGLTWAALMLAATGFLGAFFVVPVQTHLQDAPPDGARGQTFAVNNFLNFICIFLAGVFYLVARALAISPAVAAATGGLLLLGYVVMIRRHIAGIVVGSSAQ